MPVLQNTFARQRWVLFAASKITWTGGSEREVRRAGGAVGAASSSKSIDLVASAAATSRNPPYGMCAWAMSSREERSNEVANCCSSGQGACSLPGGEGNMRRGPTVEQVAWGKMQAGNFE